ncbi:MAG: hypothetical protein EOM20_19940 [Spartobacteria bacterium]|nr:hypothetical protein [Spartobacteria bacterium]
MLKRACVCAIALGVAGCGDPIPYSSSGGYTADVPGAERARTVHSDDEALELVKQGPAQNSDLTNAEWAKRLSGSEEGQVIFPQWKVQRKGTHQYEVRYTYTVLEPDHVINKKGVSWTADLVLRIVGPPRELPPQEMAGHNQDRWLQDRTPDTNTLYKKTIRKMPVLKE